MIKAHKWYKIALFNLLVLAIMGFLLRYKIAFSLPLIDQKHLLHSHSHFAFSGWVSLALMTLQTHILSKISGLDLFKKLNVFFWLTLISSWGMLVSFLYQGYGAISISFSTLFTIVNYLYVIRLWKFIKLAKDHLEMKLLFKAGLLSGVFSSIGTFSLAVLMANHVVNQKLYLASVYFYLHFQYNGYFILTCLGVFCFLFSDLIKQNRKIRLSLQLFVLAVLPAYFLSTLWMQIPWWLYVIVVFAALAQVAALILLYQGSKTYLKNRFNRTSAISKWLLILVGIAFSVKIILQAGSTIPKLSQFAFGFRPIIIGYLHLVLLGVITLFIIYSFTRLHTPNTSKKARIGIYMFSIGIICNELFLMLQGITAMDYFVLPYTNEMLLLASSIMVSGLVIINWGINKSIWVGQKTKF